jgi:hypothetical protein
MPDKEWTDTEWLDAGWADMARRLDEAMPVESRRRRGLFWWWGTGGLATILLLLGSWWLLRAAPPAIEYFPIPRTGQAQVRLPAAAEADAPSGSAASAATATVAAAPSRRDPAPAVGVPQPGQEPALSVRNNPVVAAIPTAPRPVAVADPVESSTPAESMEVRGGQLSLDIVPPSATESASSAAALTEVAQPASAIATSDRRQAMATPLLPVPVVRPEADAAGTSPLGSIVPVRRGTWRAGAEVVHTGDGVGGYGAGAGVLLRRGGPSRWSLTGGLRYHYWSQTWGRSEAFGNQRTEDVAFADSSALWMDESVSVYRVAQPGGENFRVLVARDPAANPRVRTHWLEMPLRVDRRFGRRWSVGLGVRPALLLNSSVTVPAVPELTTTTGNLSSPESLRLSNAGVSEVTTSVDRGIIGPSGKIIRRWHLGWEVGVAYHFGTNWTAGVQYRQGQSIWQRDSELRSRTGLVALRLVRWW